MEGMRVEEGEKGKEASGKEKRTRKEGVYAL